MRPERKKRHHYFPVFLQKHFTDVDGLLWYGIRAIQEVKKVSPRDAFVEKDLYTSYEEADECPNDITYQADDRYEREFAKLESQAAPAIEKLVVGTRHLVGGSNMDPFRSLSPAEITSCKELLISLTNRTPDAMKSAIARARPQVSDAISRLDLRPLRRLPDAVQDTFLERMARSAMAHVASSSHLHVPEGFDLSSCGLAVAVYSNPSSRFILGSCGVAHLPVSGDPEYLDGTWLPIAPDQAIGLDEDPDTIVLHKDWEDLRRRVNQALANGSRLIAGNSRSLVERMLHKHY